LTDLCSITKEGNSYLRPVRAPFKEDVILLGDAAGLCGPFLGDGIQTAVKSGIAAARAVEQPNVDLLTWNCLKRPK